MTLLETLGIDLPIIQAPMAGVSTPAMAAAVANAGALGSIGVGATDAAGASGMIAEVRAHSTRSLHVNVFCHRPPQPDAARAANWIEHLRPQFERFGATPPDRLREVYRSFVEDDAMLAALVAARPRVVSFHFGLPSADCLGTLALTRLLVRELDVPVIAAGGIMDGAGISAALRLGAGAALLGTAFIACPESDADAGYRALLASDAAHHTVMTRAISGRPARCLANEFTRLGAAVSSQQIPAYPIAYDAGKALNAAAKAAGETRYGAQWAGQGAPLARSLPAAKLIAVLSDEMH